MVKLLRDSLGGLLPPGQARALETGIDIIGDIAIVKLGEEAKECGPVVGEAIMASMKNVKAVFDQEGASRATSGLGGSGILPGRRGR